MSAPKRIQLRRTKGWRKPEGAIVVSRPSRWGNPFADIIERDGLDLSLAFYKNAVRGMWIPPLIPDSWDDERVSQVYAAQDAWQRRFVQHPSSEARWELGGRDLACWCPLDRACHGDVLLEVANS